ncbi:hypothetical protein [Capnocytophaga endodontalis]|jgi:hypothetical protein|uniref:Uncharacterized protein n=1 Tax=Capnocytophaga endodontalis TaxID=2708117 RepID=A0A1Z4BSG4_9FLAO|nr:hypothetical protein [Capnocytophaga endodontalis]ASF44251.1 hypothetical protein CBG49_14740 [Capnocytophaga endodontalis]
MGIFKKANNIYITVRDTYTMRAGSSYEEAEEITITATDEIELISAKKVIMQGLNGGVEYGTVNKDEPKIIMSYFTDLNDKILGNRGEIGDEVYLVVEGKNLAGKKANLDLTDDEIDFEYNGERLENDILKGYVFKNDKTEHIKLKIIEQKND